MHSIEFRRVPYAPQWSVEGGSIEVLAYLIDGASFLESVRRAELPDALAEQAERADEFAPDPAPLPAGTYMYAQGFSLEHLLGGKPDMVPHGAEEGETILLGCDCGIFDCWALTATITAGEDTVTWSNLQNTYRDWNYDSIGTLTFSRRQYETSWRTARFG
ncbi:hypothetical protein ACIBSV_10635 [Embleya sp. NPDC050154]|uniref:hypothetical protein n=1 Tax=Embleya sp. NPDC050154 TaxID=3363988 RepID=UPI00378E5908